MWGHNVGILWHLNAIELKKSVTLMFALLQISVHIYFDLNKVLNRIILSLILLHDTEVQLGQKI